MNITSNNISSLKSTSIHIDDSNKMVGVTLWVGGKEVPEYISDIIDHNSNVLDYYYIITNEESGLNEKLYLYEYPSGRQLIEILDYNKFSKLCDKYAKDLKPNFQSDILAYNSIDIIYNLTGIKYKKVLTIDADFILTNRWLLKELFDNCNSQICLKDKNIYMKYYPTKEYYNAGVFLDVSGYKNCDKIRKELLSDVKSILSNYPNIRYTAIGPGLVNNGKWREIWNRNVYSNIKPNCIEVGSIGSRGAIDIDLNPESLGVHLTQSTLWEVGYYIAGISVQANKLYVEIEINYNGTN